jgi:hypothetical protein
VPSNITNLVDGNVPAGSRFFENVLSDPREKLKRGNRLYSLGGKLAIWT